MVVEQYNSIFSEVDIVKSKEEIEEQKEEEKVKESWFFQLCNICNKQMVEVLVIEFVIYNVNKNNKNEGNDIYRNAGFLQNQRTNEQPMDNLNACDSFDEFALAHPEVHLDEILHLSESSLHQAREW